MECELCSTSGQGGGTTRCQRCGFDTTLPPDVKHFLVSLIGFRPGELVEGRYRIDRILGYGGMSVVYKAHDEVLGEVVAIKVINRGRMGDDNKFLTDIRRDIVTTRKLAHPDIVKIYDFHKTDTCGFLTMEFVPGDDVASLIAKRGKLDEVEVCRIALQIAEALSYAHANGVVHCDIKPGNLLLAENGRVKIADFGISRLMHEENTGLTGLVVGTPAYMAPEQIRGERPGPRTDMYSLGIVMWHCLMGAPPFIKGDIAYQHVHVPLPPLTGVSPEVEQIVRRAASKAIDDRYPSMAVMAQELHEILRTRGHHADATLVQAPSSGFAATLLEPPVVAPSAAAARLSPELAGTVLQTLAPAPIVAAASIAPQPEAAGTIVQSSAPTLAGTVAQPRSVIQSGTVAHVSTPGPAVAPEQLSSRQSAAPAPAGGGVTEPPPSGGPPEFVRQPAPAAPPAASNLRMATIVGVLVLLAGAAAWALLFRSPEAGKPGEPQMASGVGLPPIHSPPGGLATATAPPPDRLVPGAASPAPPRAASAGSGVAAGAVGAVADTTGGRSERPAVAPLPVSGKPIAPAAISIPATAHVSPPEAVAVPAVSTPVAPFANAESKGAPLQSGAAEPLPAPAAAVAAPAAITKAIVPAPANETPPATVRVPVPVPAAVPAQPQPPVLTPAAIVSPQEPEPARSASPPATRDLGLPIQTAALQRGRWCDLRVRAVGTGVPMANDRSGLSGERSATLDAYRRILEYIKGVQVSGGSTVKDFITTDATYKTKVEGVIRGARQIDRQKNGDGTWSVVMELSLAGMCDVIPAGTP